MNKIQSMEAIRILPLHLRPLPGPRGQRLVVPRVDSLEEKADGSAKGTLPQPL